MVRYTAQSSFILRQVVICVTSVAVSTFGCLLDEQSIADNKNLTCFVHATLTMLVAMISNRDVSPGFLTITFLPALAFSFVAATFMPFVLIGLYRVAAPICFVMFLVLWFWDRRFEHDSRLIERSS